MNLDKYDVKERKKVAEALLCWIQTQKIEPVAAAYIMARLAGTIIGQYATGHEKNLTNGVDILTDVMRMSAIESMLSEFNDDSKK